MEGEEREEKKQERQEDGMKTGRGEGTEERKEFFREGLYHA